MTRVIDLGNGYGRVKGYGSPYASLTFPLTLTKVRKLHAQEIISDSEAHDILSEMGYDLPEIKWVVALDKIDTNTWKARLENAGTI